MRLGTGLYSTRTLLQPTEPSGFPCGRVPGSVGEAGAGLGGGSWGTLSRGVSEWLEDPAGRSEASGGGVSLANSVKPPACFLK